MNNIADSGHAPCTGCGACVASCPVSAISYCMNDDGFFEAQVRDSCCVHCGKCKAVCLKYLKTDEIGKRLLDGTVYAATSTDPHTIHSCTSGGIAFEIAQYGLNLGYIVAGVMYDYAHHIARTTIAHNMDDLVKMKGSKYLQSESAGCFAEISRFALCHPESRFMIFGTPCQITGIKKCFQEYRPQSSLVTIDLFCHGVPSYLVWNEYRKWLQEKHGIAKINKIDFRSKHIGWHDFTMEIHSGKKRYFGSSGYDLFYRAYLDDVLLNRSCQKCEVRKEVSCADIRLGDFWGKLYQDNQEGISAVLVLTEQGKQLLGGLEKQNRIHVVSTATVEECTRSQSIEDYPYSGLSEDSFDELRTGKSLVKTISNYRKHMAHKHRLKLAIKEAASYLPASVGAYIKGIYRKHRQ